MRERVALCEGELDIERAGHDGYRLLIRMPRAFEGVFA
jgi:signal transduction histidine kinase